MFKLRNEVCTYLIRGNEAVQLESEQFGTHIFTTKDMIGLLYKRLDSIDGLEKQDEEREISHIVFNNYNKCKNMTYAEFKMEFGGDTEDEDYFNHLTRFEYYEKPVTLSDEEGVYNGRKFVLFDEETLNLIGSYLHYTNRMEIDIYDECITYDDFKHVKFMLLKNINDMFRLKNEAMIEELCYTSDNMTLRKLKNKLCVDDSYQEFFYNLHLNRYYDTAYFPLIHRIKGRTQRIELSMLFVTDLVKALLYSPFNNVTHVDLNNRYSDYTNLTCIRDDSHNAHLFTEGSTVYYKCRKCSDEDNDAISDYLSELYKC